MLKLTADNVEKIFKDSLAGELTNETLIIAGILYTVGFNREKIDMYKPEILELLKQLRDSFFEGSGDGMSFLEMVYTIDDVHWAEHRNAEQLYCLGAAIGKARFTISHRGQWSMFPGSMPYITITR